MHPVELTPASDTLTDNLDMATELALRWESYLTSGLDKETRKSLLETWKTPSNCRQLTAPVLNPEIQALLSQVNLKKNKFLQNMQDIREKEYMPVVQH